MNWITEIWNWFLSLFSDGGSDHSGGEWRGVMFVPATAGMPNNRGVSSQLDYRGCHTKPNENAVRVDMLQCVKNWGGNTLVYIRGEFCRGNPVLDMALNGMAHPTDGHYFPIKAPTSSDGEVDWAMWAKDTYGIDKHVCWIWNDNTLTPFTEAVVREAVGSYDGCRLGMENVMFGVCLETDEPQVMPDVNVAVRALDWITRCAPQSQTVVGSANEDYLIAVGENNSTTYLWLEQSGHPITAPLTRSTFPAYLASLNRIASKCGKERVIPGEWRASNPDDVKWMTDELLKAGYTFLGMGKYN